MSDRTKIEILCDNRTSWLKMMEKPKVTAPYELVSIEEFRSRVSSEQSADDRFGYYGQQEQGK